MVDSSSAALLEEMNSKAALTTWWPIALVGFGLAVGLMAGAGAPPWATVITGILGAGIVGAIGYRDVLRKTVVLLYEMEPHSETAYQALHDAVGALAGCQRVWHLDAKGNIDSLYDYKTHAGASTLVERKAVQITNAAPPKVKTNIAVPRIPGGCQTLYLFPDRMLVFDGRKFGAVGYEQMAVETGKTRFIEEEGVPADSEVVGSTWRYVNKSGGPDRRFNDNREIPIAQYELLFITSVSGLKEIFYLSRIGSGAGLKQAVPSMAKAIANRKKEAPAFLKCPCNNCEVNIEFPANGAGQIITCPRCGLETRLFKPVETRPAIETQR
jgi:hypothetical protein